MGSVFSSGTEIVCHGAFDMPGVPAHVVAEETFRDIQAAPTFISFPLTWYAGRRRKWGPVGSSGGKWEASKSCSTITKRSDDPFFMQSALTELVETNSCTVPDFVGTYTLVIEPSSCSDNESSSSCSIRWTHAIVSRGLLGRLLSVFCVPCMKR